MKKILFPTDFSKNASHALKYAVNLCEALKAELVLFHSCRVGAFAYQLISGETNEEDIIEDASEKLKSYTLKHLPEIKKVKVEQVVEYGLAVDNILDTAKKKHADMIVMGTKGASGLEEIMLGSNTASVIEKSPCPVLAIPEKSKYKKIQQIVFATDYRDNDAESIKYLSGIAASFNADLIIVHVADFLVPVNYEKSLLDVFAEDIRKKVPYKKLSFHIIRGVNASKALNQFVKENNIDLIALSMRKKNILTALFDVSITKKMAYHSSVPLLAFHAK